MRSTAQQRYANAALQAVEAEIRAKWCGLEAVENGTKNRGRIKHAWHNDNGSTGLYIELDVPTMLRTAQRTVVTDSEHWTIVRER
jgi:hypothetical protein